jgi:HEAT repeat protein
MLPPQTLPVQIVSLCDHPMPKVRSRALHALAVHLHPQALPRLIAALDDRDWMARRSAIGGLAVLGDDEALARLEQLLDDSGEMVRAEAVTELAHTRAWQVTDQALGDKSHRVREALAASLAGRRDSTVSAIAEKLIADRAVTVQAAMLTATRGWPNSLAGDVLISGLTSRGGATRHGCRDELLRRWPTAQTLILDVESTLSESTQSEVAVADLRRRWHAEFGDTPPLAQATDTTAGPPLSPQLLRDADALLSRWVAAEQRGEPLEPTQAAWTSLATGPLVVEALGRLVSEHGRTIPNGLYEHVLPRLDSTFEVLSHMTSSDLNERRAAAGELRDRARTQPLSPLVVARLRQVLVYERDALVWQAVLIAIQSDHDQDAMTLASVALGHDQAMIRSQACQHITAAANSEYAHLLVDAITDTDQSVRRAALRGLAFPRSVDDVTPLLRFLADTDVTMRFEAARTLTIIGSPEGFSALERMAHHDDANVRRMVAELMGELAQSRFTATLVQMLDDESRVQRSALASLPSCAGDATPADIHDRGNSQSARVGIWQDWWAKSQPSGDGSLRAARR